MLDAAIDVAPQEKEAAAKDYVFLLLFEQRQGAICFTAVAAGALYGTTLSLIERAPLHVVFGVSAVLMMLVNANHSGIRFWGAIPGCRGTASTWGSCSPCSGLLRPR